LEQDAHHFYMNEPELRYCREHDCEDCHKKECPPMKKFMSSFHWGENSVNTITSLIGSWDMYCCGRKEYKDGE